MRIEYKTMKPVTALLFLAFGLSSQMAEAVGVTSKEELKLLPPVCKGTQLIRDVSGDKTPLREYQNLYGTDFQHLHHYCWALNTENKYYRNPSSTHWKNMLGAAIGDLDYVIKNSSPTFVFLPDVYLAKARILVLRKQNAQAMASAHQAINAKPDFERAYIFISDLYSTLGDKKNAIKTLQSGLEHTPESKPLLRRLTKLGGTPPELRVAPDKKENAAPISLPETEAPTPINNSMSTTTPDIAAQPPHPAPSTEQTSQPELQPGSNPQPPNPYCRFCP